MLKPSVETRANQETLKALTPDDTLLPSVAHRFETTTTTRGYMIEIKSSFSLAFQIENYGSSTACYTWSPARADTRSMKYRSTRLRGVLRMGSSYRHHGEKVRSGKIDDQQHWKERVIREKVKFHLRKQIMLAISVEPPSLNGQDRQKAPLENDGSQPRPNRWTG